jgi:steroid delta-isomerase
MQMDAKAQIELVQDYVAAYNAADVAGILALYAPDASMEDPVGDAPVRGAEAIAALYRAGFAMGIQLELDGPVRCTRAAVAFGLRARTAEGMLSIIDVFDLTPACRIARMRAYWGPANLVGEMRLDTGG